LVAISTLSVIWYKNDGNQNFTEITISSNIQSGTDVMAIDVDSDNDIDVLASSKGENTIYMFANDGNNNFSEEIITNQAVDSWALFAVDMDQDLDINVISGTYINGEVAWYENMQIITSVETQLENPDQFYLSQNYPNSFNPSTSLQYAIGSLQLVTIKIYNLLGREIATLVDEYKSAGQY